MKYCGIGQTAICIFPGVDDLVAARPIYLSQAKVIGRRFDESETYPISKLT